MPQISSVLTLLRNGQTEYDFIGITSNGVDCIYFVYEDQKFNIEFEAIKSDQIPFIETLKKWSDSNGFRSKMTTYNNQPQYKSDKPDPVIRIETNSSLEEATELGRRIEIEVFGNSDDTVYEVVP